MFGYRICQNEFCALLNLIAIVSQKQTLATANSFKLVETILSKSFKILLCPRTPPHLWMVHLTEYFLCLINPLPYFKSIIHLFWSQDVGLYAEYPPQVNENEPLKLENTIFTNRPHVGHLIKGSCLGFSAPWLVWCWYIFYRLRHVFHLSRDPTKPLFSDATHTYGWELIVAYHNPDELGYQSHSDSKRKNISSKMWIW